MELVVEYLSERIGHKVVLKQEQRLAIEHILRGVDVLAVLPTGFGKSLVFQVFAIAKANICRRNGELLLYDEPENAPRSSVLVICPLESIVKDQLLEAQSLGLTAVSLTDASLVEICASSPQLIYASPEKVEEPKFQRILKDKDSPLHQAMSLLVVDESHTVETWTGKRNTGNKGTCTAFRSAFGKLSTLRSLCKKGTPVLALTGTADKETINTIISSLALKDDHFQVFISPNRPNIRVSVMKRSKKLIFEKLDWVVNTVKEKGPATPKTIIFCNTVNDIASVLNHLLLKLGENAFSPLTSRKAADCLIDVYHAMTWTNNKDRIVASLKETGENSKKRVTIASTALSMGVNFPDIRYVINWGPARNLLDYHQEAGRAGRDGEKAHVIVIYHGQMLSHCEPDIKTFVKSEHCLRVASLLPLDPDIKSILPGHDCCLNCHKSCTCNGNSCDTELLPHEFENHHCSGESSILRTREVTEINKSDLHLAMVELTKCFAAQGSLVLSIEAQAQLITDLIKECHMIFTVKDVVDNFPVLSLKDTFKILEVFHEIFGDIDYLTETLELLQNFTFELDETDGWIECAPFFDDCSDSELMCEAAGEW